MESPGADRLQKFLAHAGVGSRRACEDLILQGRVTVGGKVIRELGTKVDPAREPVAVDGQKVQLERPVYFAVYKPKGYVSTNDDPSGRPRVLDLLPEIPQRVYTVGRLDEMSVGLMLLTNDGELANKLAHPRFGVEKLYRVAVAGSPTREVLAQLTDGIWLAEGKVRAKRVRAIGKRGESTILELVLAEGKNREVRRMLAKLGHKVMTLTRVAVGPITTKGLTAGQFRPLTSREVDLLRRVAAGQSVPMPWMEDRKPRREPGPRDRPGSPTPQPRFADGRRPGSGTGPLPAPRPGEGFRPGPRPQERQAEGSRPGPRPQGRPGEGHRPGPRPQGRPEQGHRPGPRPHDRPEQGPRPGPQGRPGDGYRPGPGPQGRPFEGHRPGPRPHDRPGDGRGPGPRPYIPPAGPTGGRPAPAGRPPMPQGGPRAYFDEANRPSNRPNNQGPRPHQGGSGGPPGRPANRPRPDDRPPGRPTGPGSRPAPGNDRGPRPVGARPPAPRRPGPPPSQVPPARKIIGMPSLPAPAPEPEAGRDDRPRPRMKRPPGPGKRPAPRAGLGSKPRPKRRRDGEGPAD